MQITTHRKTDTGYSLTIEAPVESDEQALALAALGSQTAGDQTVIEDGTARVTFTYGPPPVDPETGEPTISEKDYAEMQARESALLIQSALDSGGSGKGKKLATEGTLIEPEAARAG